MSNTKTPRAVLKLDVPTEIKERLETVSRETGFSMTLIVTMLVKYYLTTLDIEHEVRRTLVEVANKKKLQLRLSKHQQRVIADVQESTFTKDLI